MPGKPFQSKLIPHSEFIRESRARGLGYREIAAELHSAFRPAHRSGQHLFIREGPCAPPTGIRAATARNRNRWTHLSGAGCATPPHAARSGSRQLA
jgi:hypothetical protein